MNKNIFTFSDISLKEGQAKSQVEVLRTGVIRDREWRITDEMLEMYVKNFKENVYGTEVQVNLEHNRGSEAAGWVKDLYKDGSKLFAEVEWTELGTEKITKKLFKFVSAELALEYPHHESGEICQNVFIGLALTNTPALKGQKALALSEIQELNNTLMLKKFIELLTARAFVSKEEKETMRALLAEASEEEKAEVEAGTAEVEAKPEEVQPTEEELAKKKADEEAAAAAEAQKQGEQAPPAEAPVEPPAEAPQGEQLSEVQLAEKAKLQALEEENKQLKQEKLLSQIQSGVEVFMLSDNQKTGFVEAKSKSKLVDFLASLSEENRSVAMSLFAEILRVELGEKGDVGEKLHEEDPEKKLNDQKMRAAVIAKEKNISLHEALSQVFSADAIAAEASK